MIELFTKKDQSFINNKLNDISKDIYDTISSQLFCEPIVAEIKIVDTIYLNNIFVLLLHKIVAKIITKKGFKTSMGWNLGKKNKSIHLLDPLTSTPTNGTKNNEISEIK